MRTDVSKKMGGAVMDTYITTAKERKEILLLEKEKDNLIGLILQKLKRANITELRITFQFINKLVG